MRTKSLFLTAAALAAGLVSSFAQSSNVYSVNVVGYVNLTTPPGFSMIDNQLSSSNNTIIDVLGNANTAGVLQDAQVLKYIKATASYTLDTYDAGSGGWVDALTGDPATNTVAPGTGFFFYNARNTNIVLTLVGNVPQGTNTVPLTTGFSLIGTPPPVPLNLRSTNGFPAVQDMQFLRFTNNTGPGNYDTIIVFDSGDWYNSFTGDPQEPVPGLGQGYFIYNPGSSTWTNIFIVP
jgi:hypothetical protein